MRNLYWFNPENDIALGRGCGRFTPPRQAALLARYGAPLMWWLGGEDDYMLVANDYIGADLEEWLKVVSARFGIGPRPVASLEGLSINRLMPWGWSVYAIASLESAGASEEILAGMGLKTGRLRQLSHRRSASEVNRRLAMEVDFSRYGMAPPEPAAELFTESSLRDCIGGEGSFFMKSPWSSSGRGVMCSHGVPAERIMQRGMAVIREQGSVMVEKTHDKVEDFAMLFHADEHGMVSLYGYSRFFNARGASYEGNMIAPDCEIKAAVAGYVGAGVLDAVESALERILTDLLGGDYSGFLGVDMMVARGSGNAYYLVPCVEINLRMTMGVVAHAVYGRLRRNGIMRVAPNGCCPQSAVPLVPQNRHFSIFFEEA